MKKRIAILFILMLVAVGTLYALSATSNAPNREKNGFKRTFLPIEAGISYQLEFPAPVRELAGQHGDSLYFMTGEPGRVYVTNSKLDKLSFILLDDPKIKKIIPRFYTTVMFPEVYILGGNAKAFAIGNLLTGKTQKIEWLFSGPFDNPIVLDSFIVARIMNTKTLDSRYHKIDFKGKMLATEDGISKGKADGGMKYSCLLKYDQHTKLFVNLHFYDNSFEVFDKNLRLLHRYHTVDTIYSNPTQIFNKDGALGYKHPPVAVNGYAATYSGKLYVRSKLLADNEDKSKFYSNTVIDCYDILSGSYEGSFYLPNLKDDQVGQYYLLSENKIVAFSGKSAIVYLLKKEERKAHQT